MTRSTPYFKPIFAALVAATLSLAPGVPFAQGDSDLDTLHERLRDPELQNWKAVEDEILREWSRSGSPAFDLLLQRGRSALEDGDTEAAIEHLTALTDHAPEFAEGWNARATAFFQAEMYGPSLSDIEMTLALNPRHFGAVYGLALILDELDQKDAALSAYRAARAIHPHLADIDETIEDLERDLGGSRL